MKKSDTKRESFYFHLICKSKEIYSFLVDEIFAYTVQELLQIDFFSSSLFGNLAKDESQIFLSYLLFRSFADYKLISLIIFQNVTVSHHTDW